MGYDRDSVIKFATKFWTSPCPDGWVGEENDHLWLDGARKRLKASAADGWEALFERDGTGGEVGIFRKDGEDDRPFAPWKELADCAHYLSQCVRTGGAKIDTQWGVHQLVLALQGLGDTKTLAERVNRAAGQRIVDSGIFKKGDMIGYFNTHPKEGSPGYGHSCMFVGDGGITCHSVCRFKGLGDSSADEWHLDSTDMEYTFIHFSSDDPAPTPAAAGKITGWWKVEYAKRVRFYFIMKDGRARWSNTAPRRATDPPPSHVHSAYWFQDTAGITFCWRNTGDVEEWAMRGGGEVTEVKMNEVVGTASKLF